MWSCETTDPDERHALACTETALQCSSPPRMANPFLARSTPTQTIATTASGTSDEETPTIVTHDHHAELPSAAFGARWGRSFHSLAVMSQQPDPLDKAIRQLGLCRTWRGEDRELQLVCLVREEDWRPLKAPWWRGKEVCLIGADINGNFLLRHCDGTVRYWDHKTNTDTVLSPSVRAFVASIVESPI